MFLGNDPSQQREGLSSYKDNRYLILRRTTYSTFLYTVMLSRMLAMQFSSGSDGHAYLRADAVPPTPKKRGRRRLTALEVLQAKSLFAGPRRFS